MGLCSRALVLLLGRLGELTRLDTLQQASSEPAYLLTLQAPHCLRLAVDDVVLAHLEAQAAVPLQRLVLPPLLVSCGQNGRLADGGSPGHQFSHLLHHFLLLFVLEKGVTECLVRSDAFFRVGFEHFFEQVHDDGVDLRVLLTVQVETARPVLLQHLVVALALEDALAEQQQVEYQPETEHVADGGVLLLHVADVDDLGCHVAGGAAADEEVLVEVGELGQAVVADHAVVARLTPEQNVLWFQVAVHYLLAVHLSQSVEQVAHHPADVLRLELLLGLCNVTTTLILSQSWPPYSSSKTMQRECSDSKTSHSFILCRLSSALMISISFTRHSFPFSSPQAASFEKALTANRLPSSTFSTRQTDAKLPLPIFLIGRNCSWKSVWLSDPFSRPFHCI